MTMHLLPAYYTSTVSNRKNKKKKSNLSSSAINHELWVLKMTKGKTADKKTMYNEFKKDYNENMKVDHSDYVSSGLSGTASSCAKRGVMVNLHKEKPEVRAAILDKASRVMPLYNKGGLQLLSPKDDLKTVGTLSRRG